MPSKGAKIDPELVYRSATPPLQQKRFPSRRRTIRRHASPPPQLRQQSTLTQLPEWSASTDPSSDFDFDEGEDDDVERPKPRRKRRKTVRDGKRQTTLTQMASSSFGQEHLEISQDDWMPGLQGEEDDDVVRDTQLPPRPHHHRHDQRDTDDLESSDMQAALEDGNNAQGQGDDVASQEIGDDALNKPSYDKSLGEEAQAERVDSARGKPQWRNQEQQQAQPSNSELYVLTPRPRTPRRTFPLEIPSSNTPQSAILSMDMTSNSPVRSPLTTRSTNSRSLRPSPTKFRTSPVPESPTRPAVSFDDSSVHTQPLFRVPKKPPTLQRQRSTIPDSEDTATQITPLKKIKFRSQIPDTQFDTFGEEVGPTTETQFSSYSYTQLGGGTYDIQHDFQSYDPVCSALDRDAARFMQTQRLLDVRRSEALNQEMDSCPVRSEQHPPPTQQSQELGEGPHVLSVHRDDLETMDEDAPTQSAPPTPRPFPTQLGDIEELDLTVAEPINTAFEVIRIASSPSGKSVSSGKYPSSPPATDIRDYASKNNIYPRDEADKDSKGHDSTEHSSSPLPALEQHPPSQISTVGGTQSWPLVQPLKPNLANISSSPPALPPSTSSPPPEARRYLGRFFGVPDSEDEDEVEPFPQDEGENQGEELDLWADEHRTMAGPAQKNDDGEVGHARNRSRFRDILPDTLFDFSLPPPPTQSSLRSVTRY